MMTCLRCAVTLGVALLAACQPLGTSHEGFSGDMSAVEALGRGEAMAETLCASCHAIGHLGTSPHSDALAFRRFGWNYPIEALSESLAEGIIVGHPDMPEWQFEPQDIEALLAYIESVQEPRST
jgi:mono/diheme cytochrome c family protein